MYAQNTTVSSDRSKAEIERVLAKYGASQFAYGWQDEKAVLGFRMNDRFVRFDLPIPDLYDFRNTEKGRRRVEAQALVAREQEIRRRWRSLLLVIKAKLEAVESGITEFESEFLAHIVLPDGKTFGAWARPQIATAYEAKKMPPLLSFGGKP